MREVIINVRACLCRVCPFGGYDGGGGANCRFPLTDWKLNSLIIIIFNYGG